jgi:hypothetical protein
MDGSAEEEKMAPAEPVAAGSWAGESGHVRAPARGEVALKALDESGK